MPSTCSKCGFEGPVRHFRQVQRKPTVYSEWCLKCLVGVPTHPGKKMKILSLLDVLWRTDYDGFRPIPVEDFSEFYEVVDKELVEIGQV